MIANRPCAARAALLLIPLTLLSLGIAPAQEPPPAAEPRAESPPSRGEKAADESRPKANWRSFWTGQSGERAKVDPDKGQLRFNFRFQPWADVLTWFADQADLSLVLDAPPSGTFNYTDSRSYTTAEAIDLLNGVLLSKGYTLVRRDRMLMLLPLDKGVPRDMLPQVTPEELAERGQNELVSVLLPLGNRDPAEASAEIKPFLGPYGDVQTLAKTRQLLATGTAGKLRRAAEMIASIPEPQAAATPAPSAQEHPVLATYPLGPLAAKPVMEVARALLPEAKAVIDDRTGQLLVMATPSQQAALSSALELMRADTTAERRPLLRSHEVRGGDLGDIVRLLRETLPGAQFMADSSRMRITALAPEAEQARIAEMIETAALPSDERPRLVVYGVKHADPSSLAQVVQPLVPLARLSADRTTSQIAALATPSDHEQIRQALDQADQPPAGPAQLRAQTYKVDPSQAADVTSMLASLVPGARVRPDIKAAQIVVVANESDHEQVADLLQRVGADEPVEGATLERYELEGADPSLVTSLLQSAVPDGRFTVDTRGGAVLAFARPDQHQLIAENVKKLMSDSAGGKLTVQIYRPQRADVSALTSVVAPQVPYARLTIDSKTGSLVATATADEHTLIDAALRQLDAEEAAGGATLQRYELAGADPSLVASLLQTAAPEARFTADARGGAVLVWARPEQHAQIAENLEKLDGPAAGGQPEVKVYRPQRADVSALYTAMANQTPYARLSIDARTGSLVATATPREHAMIDAVLQQMEAAETDERAARLQVYEMQSAEPSGVVTTLRTLFGSRSDVQISHDGKTGKLLVRAPQDQQAIVAEVLREVDGQAGPADTPQLMVHALGAADPGAALQLVTALLAKAPEAKVIGDGRSGQLAVLARPELHRSIKAAIDELQASAPEVEVVPLSVVDPYDAAEAIDRLFGSRSRSGVTPVEAEADIRSSRLLVRGTKEQLSEVRRLLAQMGEPLADRAGSGKRLRVVSLPGRDTKSLVEDLQRLWPSVGRNPIRVVTPSAVVPTWRNESPPPAPPADDQEGAGQPPPGGTSAWGLWLLPALVGAADEGPPFSDKPAGGPAPTAEQPSATPEPPPIVIAPGPGGVTIASDDPEALDRLESLLRTLASQAGQPGREFTVFPLKNAPANNVSELLRRAFGGLGFGASGAVSIVADSRLNAVIVRAGPNDLAAIEGLLEILDSADVPSTAITTRVERIPVKHTDAAEIAAVLSETFRTALTSSVSRQQLPMARGVSRDISALLDELNRSASGPEMTISVDERSNSLLVLAPEPLLKEVRSVVEQLDQAAEGAPRSVRVVRLQHTNAEAVERALQMLSEERREGGARRRRSRP